MKETPSVEETIKETVETAKAVATATAQNVKENKTMYAVNTILILFIIVVAYLHFKHQDYDDNQPIKKKNTGKKK